MNFITPLAFILTILLPIIIAMYLLKLRRTEQVVSSTFLWQRMVRDVEANAPWQRLRRNLLLLLQLLFLLALIFAVTRPFTWTEGSSGQAAILIFDTSASMAATDMTPNRLEAAKDQARLLISNLPEEVRGTLITAGENTQVLVSSSQDKRQLYQALESVHIQPGGSDLTSALELASAIAARQPDAEIVIFSDGGVNLPERLSLQGRVRYLPMGESGANQAISLITLEPATDGISLTAFVQVVNYDTEPVERRLTLSVDGQLVDAHDLEIPPQGQVAILSEGLSLKTEVLEAALTGSDALTLDDQVWAVQEISRRQHVTLVTEGNRFLETALALLPGIEISMVRLDEWINGKLDASLLTNQPSDLTIFDSIVPTSTLQTENILFIGPLASSPVFDIAGHLDSPVPKPVNPDDPLIQYVDLSSVSILDSAEIPLPDWARPVLIDQNTGVPLLFVGEVKGQRIAVLSFDPRHSDLPLQAAYPILLANLVDWLLPGQIGEIPDQIQPGEVVTFTPPPEFTALKVTRPDGSSTQLEIQEGSAIFADTDQLGAYTVSWGEDQNLTYVVNLSNPQELDIQPVESLPLLESTAGAEDTSTQLARREWWRPLLSIALLVLTIEWLVYNRVTLSKLRTQIIHNLKLEA